MLLSVEFACFGRMMNRMGGVAVSDGRVMPTLLMCARRVVLCRFAMVPSGVLMMLCGVLMVFRTFMCHGCSSN